MKHIKGLDTLRAFAVFFVLIQHKGIWFDDTVTNGRFIKEVLIPDGGFGVVLFFVLSGYLITYILLQQRSNSYTSKLPATGNFFMRRALRIFPIYFLLLLFLYAINYPDVRNYIAYHATYTTNLLCYRTNQWNAFSHVWTLCVEEQFYLIWPWLIIFAKDKHMKYIFLLSILIGTVSTWYCMDIRNRIAPLLVVNCFDSFGIGGLLAWSLLQPEAGKRFRAFLPWCAAAAVVIYLYWKLGLFFRIPLYGMGFSKIINGTIAVWLISRIIHAKPSRFRRYFLENRLLTFAGKVSYGIYLYHYVYNGLVYYQLNDWLNKVTTGYPALNTLVRDQHFYYWLHVALVIAFSAASYYLIERPFLRLKRFFGYNKGGRTGALCTSDAA